MALQDTPPTLQDWLRDFKVASEKGDHEEAQYAQMMIAHLNRAAGVTDPDAIAAQEATQGSTAGDVVGAAAVNALQTGTLGLAGRVSPTIKRAVDQAREQEPLASGVGTVAGGLLLPGPKINPSQGLVPLVTKGMLAGTTIGSIQGANEAEPGQRLAGAKYGAATGAAAGALLAPLPKLLPRRVQQLLGEEATPQNIRRMFERTKQASTTGVQQGLSGISARLRRIPALRSFMPEPGPARGPNPLDLPTFLRQPGHVEGVVGPEAMVGRVNMPEIPPRPLTTGPGYEPFRPAVPGLQQGLPEPSAAPSTVVGPRPITPGPSLSSEDIQTISSIASGRPPIRGYQAPGEMIGPARSATEIPPPRIHRVSPLETPSTPPTQNLQPITQGTYENPEVVKVPSPEIMASAKTPQERVLDLARQMLQSGSSPAEINQTIGRQLTPEELTSIGFKNPFAQTPAEVAATAAEVSGKAKSVQAATTAYQTAKEGGVSDEEAVFAAREAAGRANSTDEERAQAVRDVMPKIRELMNAGKDGEASQLLRQATGKTSPAGPVLDEQTIAQIRNLSEKGAGLEEINATLKTSLTADDLARIQAGGSVGRGL